MRCRGTPRASSASYTEIAILRQPTLIRYTGELTLPSKCNPCVHLCAVSNPQPGFWLTFEGPIGHRAHAGLPTRGVGRGSRTPKAKRPPLGKERRPQGGDGSVLNLTGTDPFIVRTLRLCAGQYTLIRRGSPWRYDASQPGARFRSRTTPGFHRQPPLWHTASHCIDAPWVKPRLGRLPGIAQRPAIAADFHAWQALKGQAVIVRGGSPPQGTAMTMRGLGPASPPLEMRPFIVAPGRLPQFLRNHPASSSCQTRPLPVHKCECRRTSLCRA